MSQVGTLPKAQKNFLKLGSGCYEKKVPKLKKKFRKKVGKRNIVRILRQKFG